MKKIPSLHSFFTQLPKHIYQEINALMHQRELVDGEVLCAPDDKKKEMFQIVSGEFKLCNYSFDGKEIVLLKLRPGDCCGEMPLIDGLPRATHAIAQGPSVVKVLSKENFDKMYYKHPEVSHQLNVMLCGRLRIVVDQLADATLLRLGQSLARLVHRLAFSHGKIEETRQLKYIETSHEELGAMLGVSRQSISKELKKMSDNQSISIEYGRIVILDVDKFILGYDTLMGNEQIFPVYPNINDSKS